MRKRLSYSTVALGLTALWLVALPVGRADQANAALAIDARQFIGMGDIALLYSNNGFSGGNLYTIVNNTTRKPAVAWHFIESGALSADFSSDGAWLATTSVIGDQVVWSLVASKGAKREALGANVFTGAFAPFGHSFYFSTLNGKLYRVTPPAKPQMLPLHLAKHSRIAGLSFYDNSTAAVTITANDNAYAEGHAYDEIAIWNVNTPKLRVVTKTTPPNGLILGPWLNTHELFFWFDPDHSASIMADGLPLYLLNMNGTTLKIGHTYANSSSVLPITSTSALLWENAYREFYLGAQNQLAIWPHGTLSMPSNRLGLFPAMSPNRREVAFVLGPKWPSDKFTSFQAVSRWFAQTRLAVVSLDSGKVRALDRAGSDVMNPAFAANGKRIVFTAGNQAAWINANGIGARQVFATAPPSATFNALQIAAYLPSPHA